MSSKRCTLGLALLIAAGALTVPATAPVATAAGCAAPNSVDQPAAVACTLKKVRLHVRSTKRAGRGIVVSFTARNAVKSPSYLTITALRTGSKDSATCASLAAEDRTARLRKGKRFSIRLVPKSDGVSTTSKPKRFCKGKYLVSVTVQRASSCAGFQTDEPLPAGCTDPGYQQELGRRVFRVKAGGTRRVTR
ncbi:MAG TPA: hypothetical protein VIM22_02275 [Solirubrobacteraceae bacterium]